MLVIGSCDKAGHVTAPAATAPTATSPEQAVRVLEWAFVNRGANELEGLCTVDLSFVTAVDDSAGNSPEAVWDRARLLRTLRTMFEGDPTTAPAAKISLGFDRYLQSAPDPRPGMAVETHRTIRTSIDLAVIHDDGSPLEVSGHVLFYLTRGDAAVLPEAAGGEPPPASSARWWISRIEDETLPFGGLAPQPTRNMSLSDVLLMFWNPR